MFDLPTRTRSRPSFLAFAGGVLAAAGIALSAYAAHGVVDAQLQDNLRSATLHAFGNGIGLAALGSRVVRRLGVTGLGLVLLGTLLFSGTLLANATAGFGTRLAPLGGLGMILGWLLWAFDALRR